MKLILMILMISALTNANHAMAKDRGKILQLPEKTGLWELSAVDYYDQDNLWDYIDGGAELFLSYGFSGVQAMTYQAKGQPEIIVDIFDMNSSEDAFGVFSYSRHNSTKEFGQDSQYSHGFLIFWMDHYYISIIGHPETDQSAEALTSLARIIEKEIGRKGDLPAILNQLPGEDLVESSVKYFHHYIWLNSLHYISPENILNINDSTPSVLAVYKKDEEKAILLLINYQDEKASKDAEKNFRSSYLKDEEKNLLYIEDKENWAGIRSTGSSLIIVINGSSYNYSQSVLNRAEEIVQKTSL